MSRFLFLPLCLLCLTCVGCMSQDMPQSRVADTGQPPVERNCYLTGEIAASVARNRDAGVPFGKVLGRAASTNIGPSMYRVVHYVASYVYDRPQLSPAQAQVAMQTHCLEVLAMPN